jgi:hypothetical protein
MRGLHDTKLAAGDLYYAVYDAARRRVGAMPRGQIGRETLVMWRGGGEGARAEVWRDALAPPRVPVGSRVEAGRWSGAQAGGVREPGVAALEVPIESEWSLQSALRFRRPRPPRRFVSLGGSAVEELAPVAASLPTWEFVVFALERPLSAIDFTDGPRWSFLMALSREVDVRHELDGLGYPDLVAAMQARHDDDSVTRALGNAALSRSGAEALIVPGGAGDYAALLGANAQPRRNAVLAGVEGMPLPFLRPVRRIVAEELDGRRLVCRSAPL